MTRTHDVAQLLVSCWVLSGDGDRAIPTSHGLLDRALKRAAEEKAFPEWARGGLHFVDSRIGLQCVELADVLEWAQRSELTSAPNPSYETTHIQVGDKVARQLLRRLGVAEEDAVSWGHAIRDAVEEAKKELQPFGVSVVAEE
jgi:hypothetical protein